MEVFSLQRAVPAPDPGGRLAITGTVRRRDGILTLRYLVAGAGGVLAPVGDRGDGRRRHELWRHTCFECFIARKGAAEYWEVNLAPTGDWNVYHFDGYRSGMAEATGCSGLSSVIEADGDAIRVGLAIDLAPRIGGDQALEVGICAVLEHRGGGLSYWALRHPGTTADFHHRAGFELVL